MNTTTTINQKQNALIMVVDDNPDFLDSIELTLSMEGYEILPATNGQHAWEQLQAAVRRGLNYLPHVILSDIMMPIMDGYELHSRVVTHPAMKRIPYIYLTAKDSIEDIETGRSKGPYAYLTKSCSSEQLLAVIASCHNFAVAA